MIDALLTQRRLNGLSRLEIVALLGQPTPTNKFAEHDLVYWLGPERGSLRIDSEWLVIDFGPDGRAASYRIVRD